MAQDPGTDRVSPPPLVALFDTYSLLFRAHHALPPMNTSSGAPTSALYGFSAVVLKVLREQRPTELAFALDTPKATFRHEQYEGYKAQRPPVTSDLRRQLDRLRGLLDAFGVPVFASPGYEADDVLATLAARLNPRARVLIVTGDRDLLQVVGETTRVLFVGARGQKPTLFDVEKVYERFELPPHQLPSFAALVGDSSDNLVGVPGVGPRTASKLVREFGSVAGLLSALDRVVPTKVRDSVAQHADQLRRNEELARLRTDTPLDEGPLAAALTPGALESLRRAFESLEFQSLIPRLDALASLCR